MQLASRVHRSRRHKRGPGSKRLRAGAGAGSESGSSSLTSGTSTDPSTSEMSCDTVVYRHAPGPAPGSDSGTEGEGPPPASLRSSRESLSSRSSVSRRRILTNGAISPAARSRQSSPLSPPGLASIAERMPLHGRVPGHRQQRTEVWVDSRPPPQAEASRAAMVSRWVENQSCQDQEAEVEAKTEAKPLFMTQFKTADSDSGSEAVARKVAPPPPPRRTPPRPQRPQSPEPLQEPGLGVREAAEASRVPEPGQSVEVEASMCHTEEASRVPEPGQIVEVEASMCQTEASLHPLRVLSEENLTVVSTFVADVGDLEAAEDEELDPSQFSFFSVPDFANNNGASGDYFQARLRALARIGEDTINGNVEAVEAAPAPGDEDTAPASSFSDPRFLYGSYREMATFSAEARAEDTEAMTPQKQFLLLSQSLRTPDGSSDPDLASRLEDRDNGNCEDNCEDNEAMENHNDAMENDNDAMDNGNDHDPMDVPKPKLTFAARLLRLFGSRRHKAQPRPGERSQSCDRQLEAGGQEPAQARRLHKEARCASSSPGKQRQARRQKRKEKGDTVSCLSLAPTEWEFSEARRPPQQQADRKSSGYDSLDSPEGESSSLDSSSEPVYPAPAYAVPHQAASSLHYDEVTQLKMEIRRHPSILR